MSASVCCVLSTVALLTPSGIVAETKAERLARQLFEAPGGNGPKLNQPRLELGEAVNASAVHEILRDLEAPRRERVNRPHVVDVQTKR